MPDAAALDAAQHRYDKISARIAKKDAFEAAFRGVQAANDALKACIKELASAGAPAGAVDDLRNAQGYVSIRSNDWADACLVSDTDRADLADAAAALTAAGGTVPAAAPAAPASDKPARKAAKAASK